jgi:ABC-type dipeptide/oligopeptide/nickel transport system ATPase component
VRLSVDYAGKEGVLRDVALDVAPGEIVALVGESGSGKSTLALAILRLLDRGTAKAHGEVCFKGRNLLECSEGQMRGLRGREISLVMQSPASALNPVLRIGAQLMEAWRAHENGPREAGWDRIRDLLRCVSLPEDEAFLRRHPRQLSVGQAQRVLIAMAALHRPALLIADEPTSALDVVTQVEVIALLGRLNRRFGMSILFISHDLLSVASLCHRVAIIHRGELIECGSVADIFRRPRHPYARTLIGALPKNPLWVEPDLAALQQACSPAPEVEAGVAELA